MRLICTMLLIVVLGKEFHKPFPCFFLILNFPFVVATKFVSDSILGSIFCSSSRYPRLFNISTLKADIVSRLLTSSSNWDFHFRRNLTDSEAELFSLIVLLQNRLSSSCSDFRQWSLTSSGIFSVSFFTLFSLLLLRFISHLEVLFSEQILQEDLGLLSPYYYVGQLEGAESSSF